MSNQEPRRVSTKNGLDSRLVRANASRKRASSSCWRLIRSSRSLLVGRARFTATQDLWQTRGKSTSTKL